MPTISINGTALAFSSAGRASSSLAAAVASNASVISRVAASKASVVSVSVASAASVFSVKAASSFSKAAAKATAPANCNDGTWDLTVDNYNKYNTDQNLQTWWKGGVDAEYNITWPAKSPAANPFTQSLATSFEPVGSEFVCTLESHTCQPATDCSNFLTHLPAIPQTGEAKYWKQVGPPSHYGWFAAHSIANLYSFAESFTSGLTEAGIQIADLNLDLTQTFTKPPKNLDILTRTLLLAFAFVAAVIFSFVPVIGEVIGASAVTAGFIGAGGAVASTTLGSAGGFLGISLATGASLDTKAATYGAYMSDVFNGTSAAVDTLVTNMMQGQAVNGPAGGDPTILGILEGGGWVNSSVLTNPSLSITQVTDVLRADLIQRGINYIWSQSKIWVTFANLNDDASGTICQADRNGWQASKTCADGGVYYLYRFNEDGNLVGHMDYPWGADKMSAQPFNLNPAWVTQSSAASYRAQNNGVGGFDYDMTQAPANLSSMIADITKSQSLTGLSALPGIWNLSVCDMGTHNDWNVDYTQKPPTTLNQEYKDGVLGFFFPCCCGPQCSQTAAWVQSSQQENFKTIVHSCRTQMRLCSAWPDGVTSIDFGRAGTITKKGCSTATAVPRLDSGIW